MPPHLFVFFTATSLLSFFHAAAAFELFTWMWHTHYHRFWILGFDQPFSRVD